MAGLPGIPEIAVAAGSGIAVKEVIEQAGQVAALVAILGMLLVLPLYITQRREVKRLLLWQELEPERGDEGAPDPHLTPSDAAVTAYRAPTGELTPAQRVTADRPALSRITAERAAIESPSFWRRFIARGPRHPLVLSLIAVVLAGAAVAAVALVDNGGQEGTSKGASLDRTEVPVAVLNASTQTALAGKVGDSLAAAGFTQIQTGTIGNSEQTVVLFADRRRRESRAVARELGVDVMQPIDGATRAAAPDAEVIVVVGEDQVDR